MCPCAVVSVQTVPLSKLPVAVAVLNEEGEPSLHETAVVTDAHGDAFVAGQMQATHQRGEPQPRNFMNLQPADLRSSRHCLVVSLSPCRLPAGRVSVIR